MATILPNSNGVNAQLAGIQATIRTPVPSNSPTLADGGTFLVAPTFQATLGSETHGGAISTIGPDTTGVTSGGGLIGGGGTGATPAFGAQPAAPGVEILPVAPPLPGAPGITVASGTGTSGSPAVSGAAVAAAMTTTPAVVGSGTAEAVSGFGKAERANPMKASVGGAEFGFPSFKASAKTETAPAINWGPGWKRVDVDGMWYMQHTNGTKAIPAVEYRVTPTPADKVQTIKVANGWGKKFPDGTVLVFDRAKGAYSLDAKGNKHKVALGTHTFGGVKVRVFEASVVRTLEPGGAVTVFDSRGNKGAGSKRGIAAALGSANAGASVSGGGKGEVGGGPTGGKTDGAGPAGKPGSTVSAGGATTAGAFSVADIDRLTGVARGLLDQVRSGHVDQAQLAALQAQIATIPAGILQAAGAAGTVSSDGAAPGSLAVATTATTPAASGTAGSTVAGGGAPPVAGADANSAIRQAPAGTKAKLTMQVPADMVGKQARFGQLPAELQGAVATAFGSTEGSGALQADQLVRFSASGEVSLAEAGTIYLRHVPQVRGGGPGEDLAVTVRPTRQPGSTGTFGTVSGAAAGAGASLATGTSSTHSGTTATIHATGAAHPGTTVATGGGTSTATRTTLFPAGASMRSVDLGGINGSFTWGTLPAKAKNAILDYLRTDKTDPAAKAFQARVGSGWTFDPGAVIVVDAGYASFVGGMDMARPAPTTTGGGATAPAPSRGPGSAASGHDATHAPVSGGGASGGGGSMAGMPGMGGTHASTPGSAPPVPAVADPGEHSHAGSAIGTPHTA
ncbi:MAG: hypothetical protein JWM98_25 [Thermoleophilia bacterium]|nr:hypothetical protein [Thermoleophilia bacterium]